MQKLVNNDDLNLRSWIVNRQRDDGQTEQNSEDISTSEGVLKGLKRKVVY